MVSPRIEVEGYRELQQAIRRTGKREVPKALGQLHKAIGTRVIARLSPPPRAEATGAGAGASVRPSATVRDVILRVGGAHRQAGNSVGPPKAQWGKRQVWPGFGLNPPPRPHIIQTALSDRETIEDMFLTEVTKVLQANFGAD